jgi:hypothetical protein
MGTAQRALVRNASDAKQVKRGKESEARRQEREVAELRDVLRTIEGRRVLWRFLEKCGVFESIMETSARIYYNAGKQDLGHYLLGEIGKADANAYILMQQDAKRLAENIDEPAPRSDEPFEELDNE